jgi:hypothetical protein
MANTGVKERRPQLEKSTGPKKGISDAEAADRRKKLNKPVPWEDRLGTASNQLLNVIAYPIGFGVLAVSLPFIWIRRLFFEAFSEPMDMTDKVVLITGGSSGIGEVRCTVDVVIEDIRRSNVRALHGDHTGSEGGAIELPM